jgi:signal transduction histidine kinase/CheY-like chemotaxis protein
LNLFTKITSLLLLALVSLLFVFGWVSIREESRILESLQARHGNALARVVADFSIDPLLLEDYPVLETVIAGFGRRESDVLAIEVHHKGKVVASYNRSPSEPGLTFSAPVEFHDPAFGVKSRFGEVKLRLSETENRNIILARQKQMLVNIVIAFLVLLFVMGVILRKTILNRIRQLTRRIDSVSGELGLQPAIPENASQHLKNIDELAVLNSRFDEMVTRVRDHNEALRREVERRTADLKHAKETAERANIAKSKFLAAASHDLRQPLQALALFTGTLEIKARDPELSPIVRRISSGIQAMNEMLTTLLDVSRLDAGVIAPNPSQFPIAGVFDELATEFTRLAGDNGITLRFCNSSLTTRTDPVLLGRILRNLISNAIRYTESGRILVGCRRNGDRFRVEVYDTGIGIPDDQLGEIFEDFHQVGNIARDRRHGLGLGLAIAKGMADLLGHRLSVVSQPGKGSCFSIELPRTETAGESADEAVQPPMPSHRECILLIDDEPDITDSLKALLEAHGYRAIAACSANDARQQLETVPHKPDIILADYRLSEGKNGSDAIVEVSEFLGLAVPGILLTGDTAPDRIASAARSGFGLLHKPVDPELLIATIREHLDSSLPDTA